MSLAPMGTKIGPIPEVGLEPRGTPPGVEGAGGDVLARTLAAFEPGMPLGALLRVAKRWDGIDPEQRRLGLARAARVAVLANHTSQFLVSALPVALARRGVFASLYSAGYDQWQQELAAPDSGLAGFAADVVVVSLSTSLLAFRNAAQSASDFAAELADRILAAKAGSSAEFVVTLLEPLAEELDTSVWAHAWRASVNRELAQRLSPSCVLLDLEPLIRRIGAAAWYSGQYLVTSKLPWHPDRTAQHADYLSRHIAAVVARPIKLVVVDLDNTLWGGIVGEVGPDNLDLDAQGAGLAHLRLQRFLLGLHAQGVLLAISSKNNPEDALPVFAQRREMLLQLTHFAAVEISWQPKSQALASILEQLNLSPTAVAFIDDNPHERGEIRHAFPGVHVPEWPQDPIDLVPELVESGRFMIVRSTAEDRNRQEFYRLERVRQEERTAAPDLSEYYRRLELSLAPLHVTQDHLARVLDLLGKTNQFNLTTRRHGPAALEAWLARPGAYVRAFRLSDKFGDYGVVGVLLAEPVAPHALLIDSWLLSCRAMGRTVEDAMFRHLCAFARQHGVTTILGDYLPTAKNAPVAELYPRLGFEKREALGTAGQRYAYTLTDEPGGEAFVRLVEPA